MKAAATVGRSLAELLMRITATTLPAGRAPWGAAMRAELCHIGDDHEALRWAIGCLQTSLLESFRSGMLLDLRLARWSIALWSVSRAENGLCDTYLVLSHKFPRLWLPPFFAHCVQGYDYQQLIPLFDATASWEVAVCLLSDVFYLLTSVSLLRRNRNAAGFFLLAVILNLILWFCELATPLYVQSFSLADHAQDAILYVTTALLSWILWQGTRPPHPMQR